MSHCWIKWIFWKIFSILVKNGLFTEKIEHFQKIHATQKNLFWYRTYSESDRGHHSCSLEVLNAIVYSWLHQINFLEKISNFFEKSGFFIVKILKIFKKSLTFEQKKIKTSDPIKRIFLQISMIFWNFVFEKNFIAKSMIFQTFLSTKH